MSLFQRMVRGAVCRVSVAPSVVSSSSSFLLAPSLFRIAPTLSPSDGVHTLPARHATVFHKWNKVSKLMVKKHKKQQARRLRNGVGSIFNVYPEITAREFTRWPRPESIVSEAIEYNKPAAQLIVAKPIEAFVRPPY